MGLLSFVRYALASVLRNRRRSLFAVIGIVIALSLVSGSWIAVDSSGLGVLRAALRDIRVDFVGYPSSLDPSSGLTEQALGQKIAVIESVDGVESAAPYVSMSGWELANATSNETYSSPYWGYTNSIVFLPHDSGGFFGAFGIQGSLPDLGTVAIPEAVSDALNISVGDEITLSFTVYGGYFDIITFQWVYNNSYVNLSFPVSQIWTQASSAQPSYITDYIESGDPESHVILRDATDPVILNLVNLPLIMNDPAAKDVVSSPSLYYYIWIDRNSVIRLGDLAGSVDRLRTIQSQINKKGFVTGFQVYDSELTYALEEVGPNLEGLKFLFLALSAPVIGLGTYLSIVGVDLGVTERRREVGILKSRGASRGQVFASLLTEAVVLGAFSGVLGLLVGFGISRPLMDAATGFSNQPSGDTLGTDFVITPTTVILSVLLGIGLMLLSSYRPFKRASRTDVAEALHYYSPSVTQIEYKPKWDIVFVFLSCLSVASILLGLDFINDIHTSWILQIILAVLVLIGTVLFPLMPFFLSLGIIRPLTRGSRKLYSKFTVIVKPWTKELHYLVDRNIVRNPRRASNLCVIISLALAFGLFISVTMESNMAYERDRIRLELGTDVKVTSYRWGVEGSTSSGLPHLDQLQSIEGVDHAALFRSTGAYLSIYYVSQMYANLVWFDADDYASTVRPSGFYFIDGGSEKLDELDTNGTALLSNSLRDQFDLVEGDILGVQVYWGYYTNGSYYQYQADFQIMVVGFVKSLPGFSDYGGSVFMDTSSLSFIPEDELSRAEVSTGAFLDVQKGGDQEQVGKDAVEIFSDVKLNADYRTMDGELAQLEEDPFYGAMSDFLYMEYILSAAIMTVGVGLLIFVAVSDREKELACIMARGSSGNQVRKILMGESITLMIIGLVVGISVGILTAYLFNTLYTSGMFGEVERRMVFTWVSGTIVLASIVALLVASLVATARAGKIKLAEVLRIRGG